MSGKADGTARALMRFADRAGRHAVLAGATFVLAGLIAALHVTGAAQRAIGDGNRPVEERIAEVDVRMLLERIIGREGYRYEDTGDGQEALDRIARGGVDLVLLDLQMPEMSGEELLGKILALPAAVRPVVCVMTGRSIDPSTLPGGVPLILKPFEIDRLLRTLSNALGARR